MTHFSNKNNKETQYKNPKKQKNFRFFNKNNKFKNNRFNNNKFKNNRFNKNKFVKINKHFKWKSSSLAFKLKNLFAFRLPLKPGRRYKKLFRTIYGLRTQNQDSKTNKIVYLLKKKYKPKKKAYNYLFKSKIDNALIYKKKFLKKINIKVTQNNIFCTFIDLKRKRTLHIASSGLYNIKLSKKTLKRFYRPFISLFLYNIRKYCRNFNSTIFNITAPLRFRRNIGKTIKVNLVTSKKKLRGRLKLNKKRNSIGKPLKKFGLLKKKLNNLNKKKFTKNFNKLKKKKKKTPYIVDKSRRNRYHILINFISKKCFNGCRVKKKVRKKRRFFRVYK